MIGKYMRKEEKVAEKKYTFKLGTIMQGLGKRGISVCSLSFCSIIRAYLFRVTEYSVQLLVLDRYWNKTKTLGTLDK
jgi:hypothetical protein